MRRENHQLERMNHQLERMMEMLSKLLVHVDVQVPVRAEDQEPIWCEHVVDERSENGNDTGKENMTSPRRRDVTEQDPTKPVLFQIDVESFTEEGESQVCGDQGSGETTHGGALLAVCCGLVLNLRRAVGWRRPSDAAREGRQATGGETLRRWIHQSFMTTGVG